MQSETTISQRKTQHSQKRLWSLVLSSVNPLPQRTLRHKTQRLCVPSTGASRNHPQQGSSAPRDWQRVEKEICVYVFYTLDVPDWWMMMDDWDGREGERGWRKGERGGGRKGGRVERGENKGRRGGIGYREEGYTFRREVLEMKWKISYRWKENYE